VNDAQFVRGGDAGIDGDLGRALLEFVVGQLFQLDTRDGDIVAGSDADFPRNSRRGVRVVTRNHHHANAGGATFCDGLLGLLTRRIMHSRQTHEHEVVLHGVRGEVGGGGIVEVAPSRAEHAQGLLRHGRVLRLDVLAILVRHGADAGAGVEVCAMLQQHVGRTVNEGAELPVRHLANHRAAFAVGVERDLVMLR